jgi:hypothetical protein
MGLQAQLYQAQEELRLGKDEAVAGEGEGGGAQGPRRMPLHVKASSDAVATARDSSLGDARNSGVEERHQRDMQSVKVRACVCYIKNASSDVDKL